MFSCSGPLSMAAVSKAGKKSIFLLFLLFFLPLWLARLYAHFCIWVSSAVVCMVAHKLWQVFFFFCRAFFALFSSSRHSLISFRFPRVVLLHRFVSPLRYSWVIVSVTAFIITYVFITLCKFPCILFPVF